MRLIATELLAAISGSHTQHDRFKITRLLKAELALALAHRPCDGRGAAGRTWPADSGPILAAEPLGR